LTSHPAALDRPWRSLPTHRLWLLGEAETLLAQFEAGVNPLGGFHDLDEAGRPYAPGAPLPEAPGRPLHVTTRMVHCYAIRI